MSLFQFSVFIFAKCFFVCVVHSYNSFICRAFRCAVFVDVISFPINFASNDKFNKVTMGNTKKVHLANIFRKWKTASPNFFHCLFAIFCCCSLCFFDKHCKSILFYVYSAGQFPFVPSCLMNDEIEVFSLFFSANFGYSVSPPYFLIETHFSLVTSRNSDEIYFHLANGKINVLQKSCTKPRFLHKSHKMKWPWRGKKFKLFHSHSIASVHR